jgi:hypothetical protein
VEIVVERDYENELENSGSWMVRLKIEYEKLEKILYSVFSLDRGWEKILCLAFFLVDLWEIREGNRTIEWEKMKGTLLLRREGSFS